MKSVFLSKILPLLCLVLVVTTLAAVAQPQVVRYLPPEEEIGSRSQYYYELLKLALEKTVDSHGEFELVPASKAMNQRDALKAMMAGKELDVVHTMTDRTRERVLLPVRIPLVKGLIGARLMMIKKQDQDKFSMVKTAQDLQKFTLGQGHDWPDTEILRYNNMSIKTSDEYGKLFNLLDDNTIDAFPRAVFEVWDEMKDHPEKNFDVANGFYVYYPTALYFFVKKDARGARIAKRLEAGLKAAIADGSFDALFQETMKEYLEKSNLRNRTVIRLENPLLPEQTPVDDSSLWYLK